MYSALDVAERVIELGRHDPKLVDELSPLKLQKLLFYLQAWYAANHDGNDDRLFKDDIYAWKLGPVVEDVYHKYKNFGASDLLLEKERISTASACKDKDEDIKDVLRVYGLMSPYELVSRTHKEQVWKKNYGSLNKLMPFEEIKGAFRRKIQEATS